MEWLTGLAWYWWVALVFVALQVVVYFKDR